MITEKSKELAQICKKASSEEDENQTYSDFMDELYKNCDPTFDEFLQLVGDDFFDAKEYYDYHFKNPLWRNVISVVFDKRPTPRVPDAGDSAENN